MFPGFTFYSTVGTFTCVLRPQLPYCGGCSQETQVLPGSSWVQCVLAEAEVGRLGQQVTGGPGWS